MFFTLNTLSMKTVVKKSEYMIHLELSDPPLVFYSLFSYNYFNNFVFVISLWIFLNT